MFFNSPEFFIFLSLVFAGYCLLQARLRLQNLLIVIASYVFYGWWDWRFLFLMAFTSLWSYAFCLLEMNLPQASRRSKFLLAMSVLVNLGILGFFKYYNFFIDQIRFVCMAAGMELSLPSLQVILPVGISFYTFQALGYTIDVYRRSVVPTRDPVAFFAFISFFPQLVAGPIERASALLPQFLRPRVFDYAEAVSGCRQMLWGFFKKVLVADSCAVVANTLLNTPDPAGLDVWVGMLCFTFQIYGDFSGYSDIAIGCARLFGIRLMRNFNSPYFAQDIAEFWRRWHISLTTWFRDYVYIPLGGSRCGTWKQIRNTFIIFLVSGFWHGANWTFIAWGLFHALCFLPLLLRGQNRRYIAEMVSSDRLFPSCREVARMLSTFLLVVVGWVFFRSPDLTTACHWLYEMATGWCDWSGLRCGELLTYNLFVPLGLFVALEWLGRGQAYPPLPRNRVLRWGVYYLAVILIMVWRVVPQSFIYFQF
jgi:D-alanyl-lipoteichoic acid acyltransferase DltB (MBOAT superfamily)